MDRAPATGIRNTARLAATSAGIAAVMAAGSAPAVTAAGSGAPAVGAARTARVSLSSTGAQAEAGSEVFAVSANGRFVAFTSAAANLVPGDTNEMPDDFVRDRWTGRTSRTSVSGAGVQANGWSAGHTMSPDGRFITFASDASNLVPGDTNGRADVFVRDRWAGTTSLVSVSSTGAQAEEDSLESAISADGRYVALTSNASNLVAGDTNAASDVFLRDRRAGTTTRISVSGDGAQARGPSFGPAISADGRHVAFASRAANLLPGDAGNEFSDVFVRDLDSAATHRVSGSHTGGPATGDSWGAAISADGSDVAFVSDASTVVPDDTNTVTDVFVRNRPAAVTRRASVSSAGAQGNDVSYDLAISADGRYVAFVSAASTLVPGDTNDAGDLFLHDLRTAATSRVSLSGTGAQADDTTFDDPAISADGRYVAFSSAASNLVPGDTNGTSDVFLRYPLGSTTASR